MKPGCKYLQLLILFGLVICSCYTDDSKPPDVAKGKQEPESQAKKGIETKPVESKVKVEPADKKIAVIETGKLKSKANETVAAKVPDAVHGKVPLTDADLGITKAEGVADNAEKVKPEAAKPDSVIETPPSLPEIAFVDDDKPVPSPPLKGSSSHTIRTFVIFIIFVLGCYLCLHNKNKIMGLIVEGRTSRRGGRNAGGVRYRPLESEDAAIESGIY